MPSSSIHPAVAAVTQRIVQRSASGVEYFFWQASWTAPDGTRESVRFSVQKHGEALALTRACEARRKAME